MAGLIPGGLLYAVCNVKLRLHQQMQRFKACRMLLLHAASARLSWLEMAPPKRLLLLCRLASGSSNPLLLMLLLLLLLLLLLPVVCRNMKLLHLVQRSAAQRALAALFDFHGLKHRLYPN